MLTPLTADWQPSEVVFSQLAQHNIPRDFANEQLDEFRLYWCERGEKVHAWGSKFLKHCIREWRLFELQVARGEPTLSAMTVGWIPSEFTIQTLEREGIPIEFCRSVAAEFIIYWRDRGDICNTWNSKFIQHVRFKYKGRQQAGISRQSTRSRDLTEDLMDRSWAGDYTNLEYLGDQNA